MILHLTFMQLLLPEDDVCFEFTVKLIKSIGDRVTFRNELIDDAHFLLIDVFEALSMIDDILR